jgi:hypothetical protein
MKDMKRGRLKRVTIEHMYDKDNKFAGNNVIAEHEPEASDNKNDMGGGWMRDVKTPAADHDDAMAQAKQYHEENIAKYGATKKAKPAPAMDEGPLRKAMGRKR